MEKKNKPKFNVPNFKFFKSVKKRWRKPRGTHNKKRMKFKWAGALPKIGYRNPEEMRGLHPTGMKEVLITNPAQLDGLKDVVLRIASSFGMKKRKVLEEKAKALKLRIVNPLVKREKKAKGTAVRGTAAPPPRFPHPAPGPYNAPKTTKR